MKSLSSLSTFWQYYIIVLTGIIGAIIGSFLNVVALRLLSGESIVFPRSKCPKCNKQIAWYNNIPVLSYIFLRGKCRDCKEPISIQYPLVEAFTAMIFIAILLKSGLSLNTLLLFILSCGLIVITLTDLKEKLIYDITSIPLIPLGLIYNFFDIGHSGSGTVSIPLEGIGYTLTLNEIFVSAVIGTIIGALFFEVFSAVGVLLVGQRAFGEGDTIIAAALGAWFGWQMTLVILALSFVFQLIIGIPVITHNMYKDKDYKSLTFMGIMLLSIIVPYAGQWIGISKNLIGTLIVTCISFAMAGSGVFVILGRVKERQNFTFLPFGPALVFGGFVVMFWGPQLLSQYLGSFR